MKDFKFIKSIEADLKLCFFKEFICILKLLNKILKSIVLIQWISVKQLKIYLNSYKRNKEILITIYKNMEFL